MQIPIYHYINYQQTDIFTQARMYKLFYFVVLNVMSEPSEGADKSKSILVLEGYCCCSKGKSAGS